MAKHHYVPAFIIERYVCRGSSTLVRGSRHIKAKVAKFDEGVLQSGQRRNWPICVYEKSSKKLVRRLLKDVCSETNLYSLPEHKNPYARGLIRQSLSMFEKQLSLDNPSSIQELITALELKTDQELIEMGEEQIDPDSVERFQTVYIDSKFSSLVADLEKGSSIDEPAIDLILDFLIFSRYRHPIWRDFYAPVVIRQYTPTFKSWIRQAEERGWQPIGFSSGHEFLSELQRHLFQTSAAGASLHSRQSVKELDARIQILHARNRRKFVLGDNPGRPYYPASLKGISSQRLPGISDPKAQVTHPISPDTCILLSCNPDLPHFSHRNIKAAEIRRINTALALTAFNQIVLPAPNLHFFEPWLNLPEAKRFRNP